MNSKSDPATRTAGMPENPAMPAGQGEDVHQPATTPAKPAEEAKPAETAEPVDQAAQVEAGRERAEDGGYT